MTEQSFRGAATPPASRECVKSLRKLAIPFAAGKIGHAHRGLANYSYRHLTELALALTSRVCQVVPGQWIAIFYAAAMAASGTGSLLFGRLLDLHGFKVVIALTLISAPFAPLAFLGNFWVALIRAAIWGLGIGARESIIPAPLAPMTPVERRASAFGLFTAGYGAFWFLASAAIGILYDWSLSVAIAFCMICELASTPLFLWIARQHGQTQSDGRELRADVGQPDVT